MKKLFISQPMRGKTDAEILFERDKAIASVKEQFPDEEIEVIDSYFKDHNGKPLELLGKSLMLLADADIAYFCTDWDKARGCRIEHTCAFEYGIKTVISKRSFC